MCIVIDGWGLSDEVEGNAVAAASTPVMSGFAEDKPRYVSAAAHGLHAGLPDGIMGNSEVLTSPSHLHPHPHPHLRPHPIILNFSRLAI